MSNEIKYRNLYEMLEKCQYILANSLENNLKELENYPLYEAMSKYNAKYFEDMSDEELKGYGWDGESDRSGFISEQDYPEIYQTFVVDQYTHEILKDFGEITYYNEEIDMYFWGVTHYGTAWSHVMAEQYPVDNKESYYDYDSNICKFEDCQKVITGVLYCDEHREIMN